MSDRGEQNDSRPASGGEFDARGTNAFDAAGVDITLIDYMLSLTARQRLAALYEYATSAARLSPDARTD